MSSLCPFGPNGIHFQMHGIHWQNGHVDGIEGILNQMAWKNQALIWGISWNLQFLYMFIPIK
jgi:hypothetical protein